MDRDVLHMVCRRLQHVATINITVRMPLEGEVSPQFEEALKRCRVYTDWHLVQQIKITPRDKDVVLAH
jgi:hypothetical protein